MGVKFSSIFVSHLDKTVAERDNIYAGMVVKPIESQVLVYDSKNKQLSEEDLAKIGIVGLKSFANVLFRKILFKLDDNHLSEDILYDSPNYEVKDINPLVTTDSGIVISSLVKLEPLLEYFNFPRELTKADIRRLYAMFLRNHDFVYRNCELFGMTRHDGLCTSYCTNGEKHPLPSDMFDTLPNIARLKKTPNKEEQLQGKIKQRILVA